MVKFFKGRRLQVFVNLKAPKRNNNGDRKVTMTFRIPLDGNTVRSAPAEVQTAYEGVKTQGQAEVALRKEIENMFADVFPNPDNKRANMRLRGLYLTNLDVKEVKNSEGDKSVVLTCESEMEWNGALWEWLGANYRTDVFIEFDSAQATLLDVEEEPGGEDVEDPDAEENSEEAELVP